MRPLLFYRRSFPVPISVESLFRTFALGVFLATAFSISPANAQSRETWVGFETFSGSWSLYSGTTWAPSLSLTEDGVRLRAVTGQSSFSYAAPGGAGRGAAPFAEFLVGYQGQFGATTVKAFAGAWAYALLLDPSDALDLWAHTKAGPKLALETWTSLGDTGFVAFDSSASSLEMTYWTRLRAGFQLTPAWSLGPEAGVSGSSRTHAARAGGFLRYAWTSGEVALSGGIAADGRGTTPGTVANMHEAVAPYATALALFRF